MNQTKLESRIEISLNYLSGFILAYLVYKYVVLPTPWLRNSPFWTTMLFTVVSVVRSYYWRRFFAVGLHKVVPKWIAKFMESTGW